MTSYLRRQILARGLDKGNNDRGRIYRLRSSQNKLGDQPKLSRLSASELVPYLAHANGWWRDTARQQIIFKQDKSVVSKLMR